MLNENNIKKHGPITQLTRVLQQRCSPKKGKKEAPVQEKLTQATKYSMIQ
jgi:hypothetical protein